MFKFTNNNIVKECIRRIDFYREHKDNNQFDDFYHSHLDCMQELLEGYQGLLENFFYVICAVEDNKYSNGEVTSNYVTVCKKPHWESEGIMITGGLHDATKFDIDSKDIKSIMEYCKKRFPSKKFDVVLVDKKLLSSIPREVWSIDSIRGDFDETGEISGNFVKDI